MNTPQTSSKLKKEHVIFDKNKQTKQEREEFNKTDKIKRLEKKIAKLDDKLNETKVNHKNKRIDVNKPAYKLKSLLSPRKKPLNKHEVELNKLAKLTKNELFKMSTIFPFDLFPNSVIIEKKQIVITYRQFFFIKQEYHVLIEDLLMPVVETSFLFSTLKLELGPGGFQQNPPAIKYLSKKDADEAKAIITGLLICRKEKIDITELSKHDIIEKTRAIGEHS